MAVEQNFRVPPSGATVLRPRRIRMELARRLVEEGAALAAGLIAVPWFLYVRYVARRPAVSRPVICASHRTYMVDAINDVYCAHCGEDLTE